MASPRRVKPVHPISGALAADARMSHRDMQILAPKVRVPHRTRPLATNLRPLRKHIGGTSAGWHRSPDEAAAHQTHRLLRSRRSARISSPATVRVDCGDGPFASPSGASPFAPPVWTDWHDLVPGVDPRTDRPRPVRRLPALHQRARRHQRGVVQPPRESPTRMLAWGRRTSRSTSTGVAFANSHRLLLEQPVSDAPGDQRHHRRPRTTRPHSPRRQVFMDRRSTCPAVKRYHTCIHWEPTPRTRTGNRSITSRKRGRDG